MLQKSLALGFALAVSAAGTVSAQAVPAQESWAPGIGGEVRITDTGGRRSVGQFQGLDGDTLRLLVAEQEVMVRRDVITRVERRGDSLRNGFLVGAAIGLVPAAVVLGEVEAGGGDVAAAIVIGSGFYGLIGMGIDALHRGWTTVYEREAAPASTRKRHFWLAPSANSMRVGYTRRF